MGPGGRWVFLRCGCDGGVLRGALGCGDEVGGRGVVMEHLI